MKISLVKKIFTELSRKNLTGRVDSFSVSKKEAKVYCFEIERYITIRGKDLRVGEFVILNSNSKYNDLIKEKDFDFKKIEYKKESLSENNELKYLLSANKELSIGEKTEKKINDFISDLKSQNKNNKKINLWNILEGGLENRFIYINKGGFTYNVSLSPLLFLQFKIVGKEALKKVLKKFEKIKEDFSTRFIFFRSFGFNDRESLFLVKSGILPDEFKINPYSVLSLYGLNMEKVDYIATKLLKFSYLDLNRIRAFILYFLRSEVLTKNNVFLYKDELLDLLKQKRIADIESIDSVIKGLGGEETRANAVVLLDDKLIWKEIYNIEKGISYLLKERLSNKLSKENLYHDLIINDNLIEDYIEQFNNLIKVRDGIKDGLHEIQKEAIKKSIKNTTSILTGSAGTGKTTIIEGIVFVFQKYIEENFPLLKFEEEVLFMAPTGNAASRLSEVVKYPSATIHRGLGFNPFGGSEKFVFNKFNQLSKQIVIVDEISMIDDYLFFTLLQALRKDTILILVGDHNQLPSVGVGDLCYEMLDSGKIPSIKLTKVFRQKDGSFLLSNSIKVLEGNPDLDYGNDFSFIEIEDKYLEEKFMENYKKNDQISLYESEESLEVSYKERLFKEILKVERELSEENSKQYLGLTKKGSFGAKEVNNYLSSLNPNEQLLNWNFKVGDKVIQTKNYYDKDEILGVDLMNGMQGRIINIYEENKEAIIDFDLFSEPIKVRKSLTHDIELAYSISVHKSQGLGFDYIIIPIFLDKSTRPMLYRKLIYTAITRAKKKVIFIGKKKALIEAIKNNKEERRRSLVSYLLNQNFGNAKEEKDFLNQLKSSF